MGNGIWDQFTADKYHQSSTKLAAWMAGYLNKDIPVVDFGCGNAFYLGELYKSGFNCMGIEGEKLNNFHHDNVIICDLTEPLNIPLTKVNCISLEVGEHLEKQFEQTFIDNITKYCGDTLIMSWALLGQPGIGHVNTQPQEYIISEIERREFWYMEKDTMEARENIDDNCDWFRRTLLVFKKI